MYLNISANCNLCFQIFFKLSKILTSPQTEGTEVKCAAISAPCLMPWVRHSSDPAAMGSLAACPASPWHSLLIEEKGLVTDLHFTP